MYMYLDSEESFLRAYRAFSHEKGHSDGFLCDEYSLGTWHFQNISLFDYNRTPEPDDPRQIPNGCPNPFPECCQTGVCGTVRDCPGMPHYPDFNSPDTKWNNNPKCKGLSLMGSVINMLPCTEFEDEMYPYTASSYCQLRSQLWGRCQLE